MTFSGTATQPGHTPIKLYRSVRDSHTVHHAALSTHALICCAGSSAWPRNTPVKLPRIVWNKHPLDRLFWTDNPFNDPLYGSLEIDRRSVALPQGLTHSCPPQALLHGVETRTSSPVRIVRDSQTLQCVGIQGLYPCGEGAVSLLLLHAERARKILTFARPESLSFSSRHDGLHTINLNGTLGIQKLSLELSFSSRKNTTLSGISMPSCRYDDTLAQVSPFFAQIFG